MYDFILLIAAGLFVYMGYSFVRRRRDLFQASVISRAIGSLGVIAIFLMSIVIIGIMILRTA